MIERRHVRMDDLLGARRAALRPALEELLPQEMAWAADRARSLAGHGATGRLADSIGSKRAGPLSFRLEARAPYARFVEFDTQAHIIEASGRALRWESAGETFFAKRVYHPGTRGKHFLEHAAWDSHRRIGVALRLLLRRLKQVQAA